ncbi:MAG TPA: UvrD-helicase domain-containing protein [Bdellovibrionota bacterium]|jgi:ATP-dependent exoDNAse (exonuclease V) beta subunit|nr:UvrD-helicase domain-containing protein [Bdellovibrionota bacterium]
MREIVEAGAGCGKTYGLVTRYLAALGVYREGASRASRRTTPSKILTLTFTNDAATEMRTRIVQALVDARELELARSVEEQGRISTFHSFCYKVIKPHLPKLGYSDGDVLSLIESQAHKMSHVLGVLATSPLSESVQRLVDLKRLYQFCVANWRRPRRELESEIDEVYRQVTERSERWIRESLAVCKKFSTLDPTMFENPEVWPYQTLEALETREWSKLAEIKFNGKGHKPAWAKDHPEFRALAGLARDFAQKDLHEYLNADTRGREKLAYSVLFDFLEEVQRSAPPLLDFDALEVETQKFLSEHPQEAPKYDLIIVDEFQDTNRRQVEILELLMHESTELYFVGDPKQAIYSFRGGDVRVFESQKQKLQLSSLDINRRSYPHALTFMNELTRGIFNDPESDPAPQTLQPCDEKILASQSSTSEITLVTVGDKKDPKFWDDLARDIRALPSEASKAILCQQWSRAFAAFEELARRGIPVELGNDLDLSQHHLSALWIAFLKAQDSAASGEAREYWNHLAREWDLVPLVDEETPPAQDPRAWLRLFVRAAAPHRWPEGSAWLASLETWLQAHCAQLRWIPGALELASSFEKSMNTRLNLDSPSEYFAGGERAGKVVITTIHKSKGLQYDSVFLIELFSGSRRGAAHSVSDADEEESLESLPLRSASGKILKPLYFKYKKVQDDQRVLAEKKRLFYVAYTRAERNLFFYLDERGDSAKRSESLESAVWGWPRTEGLGWQGVVSEAAARVADHVPVRERRLERTEESASLGTEAWTLPAPRSEWGELPPELKRSGTRTYIDEVMFPLEQPLIPLSNISVPRPLSATPVDPNSAKELGSALHKVLERWDGRAESIGEFLTHTLPEQRTKLRSALEQLAAFDELQPLWADAQAHPERVQREMGLFVHRDRYRLSGFADLVWFRAPGEAIVLDWKSSSTEWSATAELKLVKTEAQVALYASSLAPVIPKVEIWSLAIIFEPEVRLKWLFKKNLVP